MLRIWKNMFIMLSRQRLKVALQNRWRLLSQDLMRYVLYNSAALVLVFFFTYSIECPVWHYFSSFRVCIGNSVYHTLKTLETHITRITLFWHFWILLCCYYHRWSSYFTRKQGCKPYNLRITFYYQPYYHVCFISKIYINPAWVSFNNFLYRFCTLSIHSPSHLFTSYKLVNTCIIYFELD